MNSQLRASGFSARPREHAHVMLATPGLEQGKTLAQTGACIDKSWKPDDIRLLS